MDIEIKSKLLQEDEFEFLRISIQDASEDDHEQDFRVQAVEYCNDAAYADDDQFFYDMIPYIRFYDYEKPNRLKKKIAYTDEIGRVYLNCPGKPGKVKRVWEFIYDHECLHQLWNTFGVRDKIIKNGEIYDHDILNIAADCVINHYLRDMRHKEPFKDGIFPETIEKECGVKYDPKLDTQYTLYLKLLEHKKKLKKLIPKAVNYIDDQGGGPPPPPQGQFSDDFKQGWSDAIDDVVTGKVDPLTYQPKPPTNDYEAGYEAAMAQMKEGMENGVNIPKGGGGDQQNDQGDGLRQIPWDIPPKDDDDDEGGGSGGSGGSDSESDDDDDQGGDSTGEGGSDSKSSDKQPRDMDPKDAAKDAQKSADEAKQSARKAQDAADRAQAKGDPNADDKQDAADEAKEAASKAQDAADDARDAANDGDRKKANEAADKAAEEAQKAKDAADEAQGKTSKGKDSKDGKEAKGGKTPQAQPGGKEKGKKLAPETAEDLSKIKNDIKGIIDEYANKLSGDFGTFIKKCKASFRCNKAGLGIGTTEKAAPGWDQEMSNNVVRFTKARVFQKKRMYEKTYRRLKRGSGIPQMGQFFSPGDRPRENKMTINAAFYIDISTSMHYSIDNVWKACYILCESLKKRFGKEKVVDKVAFEIHTFNTGFGKVEFGKKTGVSGGTMSFQELLDGIKDMTNDFLINIIITDAGFQDVNVNECRKFLKEIKGMVQFITNCDNAKVKGMVNEFKTKFFYTLANSDYSLKH